MPANKLLPLPTPIAYTPLSRVRGETIPKIKRARGFSLGELKQAGITTEFAKKLGIHIDKRRKTVWPENVEALKRFMEAYKEGRVVVYKKKRVEGASPQKGRVFRGLTPAGRKSRGLVKSRLKETHRYKWKRKAKRGPHKTPSFYYHDK